MDFKNLDILDDMDIWKLGYSKQPKDFEKMEDVDEFFNPLIKCLNERVSIAPSYLKRHIEWERDCLIDHKELLRKLLNPFYVRSLKKSDKNKKKVLYLFPRV